MTFVHLKQLFQYFIFFDPRIIFYRYKQIVSQLFLRRTFFVKPKVFLRNILLPVSFHLVITNIAISTSEARLSSGEILILSNVEIFWNIAVLHLYSGSLISVCENSLVFSNKKSQTEIPTNIVKFSIFSFGLSLCDLMNNGFERQKQLKQIQGIKRIFWFSFGGRN